MAKKIQQYRFYGVGSGLNYPEILQSDFAIDYLVSGNCFPTRKILAVGIQTIPGVKFSLNGYNGASIIVGPSGIFEIEQEDNCEINSLTFDKDSLNLINNSNNHYLLIDFIYEEA